MSRSTNEAPTAVSRVEVIDAVEAAFSQARVSKADLQSAAREAGARPAVLDLLDTLPDGPYRRPSDLWEERPDVPIEL